MDAQHSGASKTEGSARTEVVPSTPDSTVGRARVAPVRRSARPPRPRAWVDRGAYPKPGWRDWTSLGMAIFFVLDAFLLVFSRDPSAHATGVVGLASFGPMTVFIASVIMRKLWFHYRHAEAVKVEITGGVPIRPSCVTSLVIYGTMTVTGMIWITVGRSLEPIFWFGWIPAVVGSCYLLGLAVGWLPVGYVQFDPEGITIARRRFAYTVPWDAIAGLSAREFDPRPTLRIYPRDLDLVIARPAQRKPQVLKHLVRSSKWFGAPIRLFTSAYGLDLPLLMKALERYVADHAARDELSRRLLRVGDSQATAATP
jgi:hypothetical protein